MLGVMATKENVASDESMSRINKKKSSIKHSFVPSVQNESSFGSGFNLSSQILQNEETQLKFLLKARSKQESHTLPRAKNKSKFKDLPETQTMHQLKLHTETQSKPESQILSISKRISKFNDLPEAETMHQLKPPTKTQSKPESQALIRVERTSELKSDAGTSPKPKAQPMTGSKLDPQVTPVAERISRFNDPPGAETMPQLKLQPKFESNLESETGKRKPEPQAESKLESQTLHRAKITSKFNEIHGAKILPQLKYQRKAELKPESNTLPRAKRKSKFKDLPEVETTPQLKPQPKTESILESQNLLRFQCISKLKELPEAGSIPKLEAQPMTGSKMESQIFPIAERIYKFNEPPGDENTPQLRLHPKSESKTQSETGNETPEPQAESKLKSQALPIANIISKFNEIPEPGILPQLKAQPKTEPKLESQTLSRAEPKSKFKDLSENEAMPQLTVKAKDGTKREPKTGNRKPAPYAESKLESQTLPTAQIISRFNEIPETRVLPQPTTELKPGLQILARADCRSKVKDIPRAETMPQLQLQPKTEAKMEPETGNEKPEPQAESKLESQTLPIANIISKFNEIPEPRIKAQLKTEAKLESQTLSRVEPKSKFKDLSENEAMPQLTVQPKAGTKREPEIGNRKLKPQAESKLESQNLPRAKIILSKFNGIPEAGVLPQLKPQPKAVSKPESQTLPTAVHTCKSNELRETGNMPRLEFASKKPQKTEPSLVSEAPTNFPFRGQAQVQYDSEIGQLAPKSKVESERETEFLTSKESSAEGNSVDKDQKTPKTNYSCTCGTAVTLGDLLRNVDTNELAKELNKEDLFPAFKKLADLLRCETKLLEQEDGVTPELEAPAHQSLTDQRQSSPQSPPIQPPAPPPPPPPPPPLPLFSSPLPAASARSEQQAQFIVHPPKGTTTLPLGLKPKTKWDVTGIKRAHWKTIDPKKLSDKSIWLKVQEEELASTELVRSLKTQFSLGYHKNSTIRRPSTKEPKASTLAKAIGFPTINLLIILKSLKQQSSDAIQKSILACEHDAFSVETLDNLLRSLPHDALEEIRKVIVSKDDVSEKYQEFLYKLAGINMLIPRLESMIFKIQHSETVQDIKSRIEKGIAACKNVVSSGKLKKILELILLCGNIMNSGSSSSPAYAFEMSFLSTIAEIKGTQSKTSLLHFLFDYIEEKFPDLLTFKYELSHVEEATQLSVKDVSSSLKAMEDKIGKLEIILRSHVAQNNDDKFSQVMGPFAKQARKECNELFALLGELEASYNDVADYFSMDKTQYTTENFFLDLKSFIDSFTNVHREALRKREAEMERMAKELSKKSKTRDTSSPNWRTKRGRKIFKTEIYRIMDEEDRLEQEANGGLSRRNCRIIRNSFTLNH